MAKRRQVNGVRALTLAIIFSFLMLLTGCSLLPKEEVEEVPVLLKPPEARLVTYEVTKGDISEVVRSLGRVAAVNEAQLYFPRTERIKKIYVAPGDEIQPGQVLAELETGDLRYRLEKAKLTLAQEELRWKRTQSLAGIEINRVDSQIAAIELDKARLEVEHLSQELEASLLKAPFAGVVVSVDRRERELVEGYETVMKVADPNELEIQVELSYSTDRNKLVRGQLVRVNTERDTWVEGHIYQITTGDDDPSSSRSNYSAQAPVIKIRLNDPSIPLEFDSLLRVVIVIREEQDAVLVPNAAIRSYMGRKYVRVLDGDVRKEVDIVTGIEGETESQVIKGLEEGQIVVGK